MADAQYLDHCLAPDVVLNQPVLGRVYKGLDKVKDLVQNHYAKARSCSRLMRRWTTLCRRYAIQCAECTINISASTVWPAA